MSPRRHSATATLAVVALAATTSCSADDDSTEAWCQVMADIDVYSYVPTDNIEPGDPDTMLQLQVDGLLLWEEAAELAPEQIRDDVSTMDDWSNEVFDALLGFAPQFGRETPYVFSEQNVASIDTVGQRVRSFVEESCIFDTPPER